MIKDGALDLLHLRRFALRDLLLGAQIAICTLLVTASLVAVRGMEHSLHTPLGFEPHGAMIVDMDLSQIPASAALDKQRSIIEAVRSIPGVTAVGSVNRTPMTGGLHGTPIFQSGTTDFKLNNVALAPYVFQLFLGFLEAAGARLLAGRDVSWDDTPKTPYVAIVNETFAQEMWGHAPAIGQHFIISGNLTEVVGVVETGKYHDMQESSQPVVYLPMSQNDQEESIFIVRSQRMPSEMTAALHRTLGSIDPNIPITVESWSDTLQSEFLPARAATVALGVMGLLAAMLAITGIFGMAAYSVSRRMKELGIRVALGARKTQLISAAIGRPVVLLGIGSAVGLLAGVFLSRLLAHIVYQANPRPCRSRNSVLACQHRSLHPRRPRPRYRSLNPDARRISDSAIVAPCSLIPMSLPFTAPPPPPNPPAHTPAPPSPPHSHSDVSCRSCRTYPPPCGDS